MLWDPLRFLESCPSSDGACAVVLDQRGGREEGVEAAGVGRSATAVRSELGQFPGRDPVRPQAGVECAHDVYRQAGISDPRQEIDVAELYVPFSWYEPMWLEGHDIAGPGEGWKMVESGDTEIDRLVPGEPVGRRAVVEPDRRVGHAALRRGRAARCAGWPASTRSTARAPRSRQAYGGAAQYFAMGILRSTPPDAEKVRVGARDRG